MITGPLHDQEDFRRRRDKHMTEIGTQSTFASGIYIGGLVSQQRSAELTEVAVTPDSFVVFDTHSGTDVSPEEELGRIPRDLVNGIHVKDDSTPMLMNVNLYVSWGGEKPGVAEFKFVNPVLAEKAASGYRDHVIT
jgi:hypothetical protein